MAGRHVATDEVLELPQDFLDVGDLVPPTDDKTAGGLEEWLDNPPDYHDTSIKSFVFKDLKEWSSRVKKYRSNFFRAADQVVQLEHEIADLKEKLRRQTDEFDEYDERKMESLETLEDVGVEVDEEMDINREVLSEINVLETNKKNSAKALKVLKDESTALWAQIAMLKEEQDERLRHQQGGLNDVERLNLERRWMMAERVLLEETTEVEKQDQKAFLRTANQLRHCMHKAWKDFKDGDTLGHLRAVKLSPYDEQWYAERRRAINPMRSFAEGEMDESSLPEGGPQAT